MIADKIKTLREGLSITQAELAKRLNITRSSVNAWEMGISAPSTQFIVELSRIFHVSTDYLLGVSSENNINISHLSEEQSRIIYSLLEYFNSDSVRDNTK